VQKVEKSPRGPGSDSSEQEQTARNGLTQNGHPIGLRGLSLTFRLYAERTRPDASLGSDSRAKKAGLLYPKRVVSVLRPGIEGRREAGPVW